MSEPDWTQMFQGIKKRYSELMGNLTRAERFLDHVRNLSQWENDNHDYPLVPARFPERVYLAYAVCHPDCGAEQVIVEGGTQECQRCGRLMFRLESKAYQLADVRSRTKSS